jgi:thiamine-phosphate pyrophosphorylase
VLPTLYAIVDAAVARQFGWTVPGLARACMQGGARLVQVRAKDVGSGAFLAMVREVLDDARACGALVVVNDRADIAALAGADGVHVGQEDLRVTEVRRAFSALRVVGLSTHTMEQVDAAAGGEATYVAVGPVYGTGTKNTGYDAVGLELVRYARAVLGASRPLVAIGGVTLERAPGVLAAGASSVAVISDLLATGDPEARVRDYLRRLS